jgi:hypothetical protein
VNHRTELNNARILDALASGRLRADPDTGRVWLDGELQTRRLRGYIRITMDGHIFGAHRVVWLDAHGHIPPGRQVNHRNKARADNRLSNLEVLTPSQNAKHGHDSYWLQPFIRGEDLEEVAETRPDWLARVVALANDSNVTAEQIAELRAETRPDKRPEQDRVFPSGCIVRLHRSQNLHAGR